MANTLAGLSLRDLEYAVAVGELRHFGRAAEQCGVSQPALSEQVRKLEGLLGFPLFERFKRGVEPTARGEALLRQAGLVVREARGLLEMARAAAGLLSGGLRMGVIATLGPYYVPRMLRLVRGRFQELVLRLQEGRTAELIEALQQGRLDGALLALPVAAEGLCCEALFFEPFRVVCPSGHRLEGLPGIGIEDLPGPDLLLLEEGHCLRDQALALCHMAGPGREARFASSLEMLRHMIAAGEGYSLLPALALQDRPDLDGLMHTRALGSLAGRTIGLVWRGTDPRRAEFLELAGFLRDTAPDGTQGAGGMDRSDARRLLMANRG